jgi:hypothetical protein
MLQLSRSSGQRLKPEGRSIRRFRSSPPANKQSKILISAQRQPCWRQTTPIYNCPLGDTKPCPSMSSSAASRVVRHTIGASRVGLAMLAAPSQTDLSAGTSIGRGPLRLLSMTGFTVGGRRAANGPNHYKWNPRSRRGGAFGANLDIMCTPIMSKFAAKRSGPSSEARQHALAHAASPWVYERMIDPGNFWT